MPSRPAREEYEAWAKRTLNEQEPNIAQLAYDTSTTALRSYVSELDAWTESLEHIQKLMSSRHGQQPSTMHVKPFGSVFDKLYRENILWNKNWPEERTGGWLRLEDMYDKSGDLVRTTLVCNYLDEAIALADQLTTKLTAKKREVVTNLGYHALHVNWSVPIPKSIVQNLQLKPKRNAVVVEIQVKTLIQSTVGDLIHKVYATERSRLDRRSFAYDYKNAEFQLVYMSNAAHLIDGLAAKLRNR